MGLRWSGRALSVMISMRFGRRVARWLCCILLGLGLWGRCWWLMGCRLLCRSGSMGCWRLGFWWYVLFLPAQLAAWSFGTGLDPGSWMLGSCFSCHHESFSKKRSEYYHRDSISHLYETDSLTSLSNLARLPQYKHRIDHRHSPRLRIRGTNQRPRRRIKRLSPVRRQIPRHDMGIDGPIAAGQFDQLHECFCSGCACTRGTCAGEG